MIDNVKPIINLTDDDADNIIKNGDTVVINAIFSESLVSTPTISLSGLASNLLMSPTNTSNKCTYSWNVTGTSDGQITALASGTDIAGNSLSETTSKSIVFTSDKSGPSLTLSHNVSNNIITHL